uniref:Trimethylguanosine synthase n=1 Tax=viral metagenome TaxID=1070528 RepID=A0A6C0M284_9ZZZZ
MNQSNYAYKFFPLIEDELRSKLLIDDVGMYSVSTPKKADIISRIISDSIQKRINPKKVVITDAMAGVGGNVISFSHQFGHVTAIELDHTRFKCMINNTRLFKCNNVSALQCNYLDIFTKLKQDIIFLDPPWGGKTYKEHEKVELYIGKYHLYEFCQLIINQNCCKILVLKLPINFNLESLTGFRKMKIYDLRKMILVLIYK